MQLTRINPNDTGFIAALEDVGMPVDDLNSSGGIYFAILDDQGQAAGYCGYEMPGEGLAFIRSCVVPGGGRRKGVGRAMMSALIERLSSEKISDLYLLTMDADPFFEKFGFKIISRDDAPETVRGTAQFEMEICNEAVLMRRWFDTTP